MAATDKMIKYAQGIAECLNLDEPNYESYQETYKFINSNKEKYLEKLSTIFNNSSIESVVDSLRKQNKKLSSTFLHYIQSDCLKDVHGIYIFYCDDEIAYIGKSRNLKNRLFESYNERRKQANINKFKILITPTYSDAHIIEPILICFYKPFLNSEFKCNDYPKFIKLDKRLKTIEKDKMEIYEKEK